jgi:putative hydrolase of the HAD superfamily
MNIKGLIFDLNGTLIDIHTDEGLEEIYRAIAHFLTYYDIHLHRGEVRDEYFRIMDEQRRASGERHPEFDVVGLWRDFLAAQGAAQKNIPPAALKEMPMFLARMYRGISRHRLALYPEVLPILDELKEWYKLAVVSDAQSAWAVPEMRALGLVGYFDPIIISGDYGYRKPDSRLFEAALSGIGLAPGEVLFVGNDMHHDVYGARRVGMKTVFFSSNQGQKQMDGVEADYIIYRFAELRQAVEFFEKQ